MKTYPHGICLHHEPFLKLVVRPRGGVVDVDQLGHCLVAVASAVVASGALVGSVVRL